MESRFAKTLKTAALAAAAACCAVGPAQAAYVVVKADPVYGAAFPNLAWAANASLYIPDACVNSLLQSLNPGLGTGSQATITFGTSGNANCAGAKIQNTQLALYDLSNPSTPVQQFSLGDYLADAGGANAAGDITQELLDLTLQRISDSDSDDVAGHSVDTDDFAVLDFNTSQSLFFLPTAGVAGGGTSSFSLNFSFSNAHLISVAGDGSGYGGTPGSVSGTATTSVSGPTNNYVDPGTPTLQLSTVPEPGSLALVLAAIGAGAVVTRRRS